MIRLYLASFALMGLFAVYSGCKQDVSTNNPGNVEAAVLKTGLDYDWGGLCCSSFPDSIVFYSISAEFRRDYSEERRSRLIGHMLTQVLALGEDVGLMRTILERAGCTTRGTCIAPTYAERAKYGGREAWIVQFTWGMEPGDFGHIKRAAIGVPELDTLAFVQCR